MCSHVLLQSMYVTVLIGFEKTLLLVSYWKNIASARGITITQHSALCLAEIIGRFQGEEHSLLF